MMDSWMADLEAKAKWVRRKVLEMAAGTGEGRVSSAFSQVEILVALYYGGILRVDPRNPRWEDRDRLILSKGHGAVGLYPILADLGFFPLEELDRFAQEGSILGPLVEHHVPGVEALTGALGHGFPIATGMALAARLQEKDHRVFCLLGDAELYEGANWEAATVAGHQGLGNLICIVDRNGQGVLGYTDQIEGRRDGPRLEPLDRKFEALGFEVRSLDGHSFPEILEALGDIRPPRDRPLLLLAHTIKGRGAPFLEGRRGCHYQIPRKEELAQLQEALAR